MIPTFLLLTAVCLLAWLLSVVVFRDHPWAMAGWLPATALGFGGTLLFILAFAESLGPSRGGAAHGFYQIGLAQFILPLLLLAPLFLGLSWYVRPRNEPSDGALTVGTLGALVALAGVFYLAHASVPP